MKKIVAAGSLFAFASCSAFAQNGAGRPEFEVASIRRAEQPKDGRMMIRMGGDPGRITYNNVSLKNLITRAFDVKDYQVEGPDWLNSERFDVTATHPPNTPKETVQLMMQALLADRFKMTFHKDKKVLPAYALTVAKAGFKLQPRPEDAGDGQPRGMMRMGMGRMEGQGFTMQSLADMLVNQVGRPVVDATGIKGLYDFTLEFTPDENSMMGQKMMMVQAVGGPGPAAEHRIEKKEGGPEAPSIFVALQEKLGLKLEARREPIDIVVIDRIEKVPTEN